MEGLQTRISLYMLVAAALIVGVWHAILTILESEQADRVRETSARAADMASFFERDTRIILNLSDVLLKEVQRNYEDRSSLPAIRRLTAGMVGEVDLIRRVGLTGPGGETLSLLSLHQSDVSRVVFDADTLSQLAASPEAFVVTLPREDPDGSLILKLARPLFGREGSFAGVVYAVIDASAFMAFYSTINLGPNSSATLVRDDKRIRARSSYGVAGPGQSIGASVLWEELARRDVGLYRQVSVVDGVTRIYAYRKMADYPLIVATGIAIDDLLSGTRPFLRSLLVIGFLSTLAIVVLTAWACRDTRNMVRLRQEVSERRAAEAELEEANIDLRQYAYAASHDLKGPLSTIGGLLDFCIEDLREQNLTMLEDNLTDARMICTRSAKKVEALLKVAGSGDGALKMEEFPLRPIIENIWHEQTVAMPSRPTLDLDLGHPEPVFGDVQSITVILDNLISNALRFADPGQAAHEVCIASRIEARTLILSVRDNGVGIDPKSKDMIFGAFQRFDDRSGDGLGLAIVKRHVERLRGSIDVRSARGRGTEFILRLPILKEVSHGNSGDHSGRQSDRSDDGPPQALAG